MNAWRPRKENVKMKRLGLEADIRDQLSEIRTQNATTLLFPDRWSLISDRSLLISDH